MQTGSCLMIHRPHIRHVIFWENRVIVLQRIVLLDYNSAQLRHCCCLLHGGTPTLVLVHVGVQQTCTAWMCWMKESRTWPTMLRDSLCCQGEPNHSTLRRHSWMAVLPGFRRPTSSLSLCTETCLAFFPYLLGAGVLVL